MSGERSCVMCGKNFNFEARNPKFETSTNVQNINDQNKNEGPENLNFGSVSDFDIRI